MKGSIDGSLAAIEGGLVRAITSAIGVTLTLPPVAGAVLPGGTISGTVDVTNDGTVALTGLSGSVAVDGLGSGDLPAGSVAPGATVQLPVTIDVPTDQAPGSYDAELTLTYTVGEETYTVTTGTADWATVTSGLEIGDLATVVDGDDPSEHATVTVPVTNTGTADVRAHARLTLPTGWKAVPSADVLVPAGGAGRPRGAGHRAARPRRRRRTGHGRRRPRRRPARRQGHLDHRRAAPPADGRRRRPRRLRR